MSGKHLSVASLCAAMALTLSCGTMPSGKAAPSAAPAPAWEECPIRHSGYPIPLDISKFPECVDVRHIDTQEVLVLPEEGDLFLTQCPAIIDHVLLTHCGSECKLVPEALHDKGRLTVTRNDEGHLVLAHTRVDEEGKEWPVFKDALLKPTEVGPEGARKLIGYHTEVELPGVPGPVLYHVYLRYHAKEHDGKRTLYKYYAVEVFENTPECRAEVPGAEAAVKPCDSLVARMKKPGQLPSGGGGEPPPR